MSTACGLQAAIDLVGHLRVAVALVIGVLGRLLGVRGLFYRVIGRAATALDDLTGTLPPYDHFVVLGPTCCQAVVDAILQRTGLRAAIVDVNNLSSTSGVELEQDPPEAGLVARMQRAGANWVPDRAAALQETWRCWRCPRVWTSRW